MTQKRDSQGRFTSDDDGIMPDLSSLDLRELVNLRDFYERNLEAEIKAARAKGGSTASQLSQSSREWSGKQIETTKEIFSRLREAHLLRSKTARVADESKDARRTRNPIKWLRNMDRFDYPCIDTKEE